MTERCFSLILLPTPECNADCEYCFEKKTPDRLTVEEFGVLLRKVAEYLVENDIAVLTIYWQGGEVMMLPPQWYEAADETVCRVMEETGKRIENSIQSNMIGYSEEWRPVLARMFGNSVGSSMDFPNLYRKVRGGTPEEFERLWLRNVRQARDAGIEVGVIALPNTATLDLGAERFYGHFVDELGVTDFQVNMPFPGGESNRAKHRFPLDAARTGRFLCDLTDVWLERGYQTRVKVGPIDALFSYFLNGHAEFPCIWRENCADEFVCIDARGHIAQCDCWVSGYPEHRFGNIFEAASLGALLETSDARARIRRRPGAVIQRENCLDCEYLALCHGGCAIRAFTYRGYLDEKDPYCEAYRLLFGHVERAAAQLTRQHR
jgi:radical SAM protein with 4Fe4S-binding SPASM domain